MSEDKDYVTKSDLKTALAETTKNIITELSEVIHDGFALAATKSELNEFRGEVNEKLDKVNSQLVQIRQKQLDASTVHNVLDRRVSAIDNRVAVLENQ